MTMPPDPPRPGMQAATPALVLASGSQTRLMLLQAAGLSVTARASAIDEDVVKRQARAEAVGADAAALRLAVLKAAAVDDPDALVIGADQILVCDGRWFDKPADLAAARAHLQALRGRPHVLQTAVACRRQNRILWQHVAAPALRMRPLSDGFIDAYLALEGDRVLSSVGAYRLEGPGLQLFDAVEGEHAAILGLPMLALLEFLRACGLLMR